MPVPRGGSASDKHSAEIGHLIRDKGYSTKRAAAAAYSMYGEENEYEEDSPSVSTGALYAEPTFKTEDGPSAASPRFDEKTLRRLLEKCRMAREARRR